MRIPVARSVLTISVPYHVRELVAEVARANNKTISATAAEIFIEYYEACERKAKRAAAKKGGRA